MKREKIEINKNNPIKKGKRGGGMGGGVSDSCGGGGEGWEERRRWRVRIEVIASWIFSVVVVGVCR